jgi:hypothetical protein
LKSRNPKELNFSPVPDDPDPAPVVDASRSGLRFLTSRPYWVGAEVTVAFPSLGFTPLEQIGRVVHIEEVPGSGRRVSVALRNDSRPMGQAQTMEGGRTAEPRTRRRSPQEDRISKRLRVWVRGIDRFGNPFLQSAESVNVSRGGARLDGNISFLTRKGQTIEVEYRGRVARFAVVWTGPVYKPHIGVCGLDEASHDFFRLTA